MSEEQSANAWFLHQWQNPRDIFTVLLVLGGDVIQKALAQESGRWLAPVTFSFGWVAYSISMMFAAFGDSPLMPDPDNAALVINARTGYSRLNRSWIIGRILRDYRHWQDQDVEATESGTLAVLQNVERHAARRERRKQETIRIGLRLVIYHAHSSTGKPGFDAMTWLGCGVAAIQLAIAAVPLVLYLEWLTFFATAAGTGMAFITGALPQWAVEKLECRRDSYKDVVLTAGNGSRDAIVIIGKGGPDMEDLAACATRFPGRSLADKLIFLVLALGWLVLMVSVAGYQKHTWYLLGVGAVGMVHNILVASAPRHPTSFGIRLKYHTTIVDRKVMQVLATAEKTHPRLGLSLLSIFFPGPLRPREIDFWDYARRRADLYDHELRSNPIAKMRPLPSLCGDEVIPKLGLLD